MNLLDLLLDQTITHLPNKTIQELLEPKLGKSGKDALILYLFLMFHAKRQKTNSVYATPRFCIKAGKGLGWGKNRWERADRLLRELGYIQKKRTQNEDGKFEKFYTVVKYRHFYQSPSNEEYWNQSPPNEGYWDQPVTLENEPLVNGPQMLINKNINAYNKKYSVAEKVLEEFSNELQDLDYDETGQVYFSDGSDLGTPFGGEIECFRTILEAIEKKAQDSGTYPLVLLMDSPSKDPYARWLQELVLKNKLYTLGFMKFEINIVETDAGLTGFFAVDFDEKDSKRVAKKIKRDKLNEVI